MHPIPLHFTIPVCIAYVLHIPVCIAAKTSRRIIKVAQGTKEVGCKNGVPNVLIATQHTKVVRSEKI